MPGNVLIGHDETTQTPVGISVEARRRSTYVIGKPGSGKSTLLENIAVADMENGDGLCFLDPHGDSASLLVAALPEARQADLIYWHPKDIAHPFGLNPFACANRDDALEVDQRVEHFLSALSSLAEFTEVFASAPRMTDILRHLAFAFVLNEDVTLLDTPRFLTSTSYRTQFYPAIERYGRYDIVEYWQTFDAIRLESRREELTASSLNKLRRLTTTTILRLIFGQTTPSIPFREVMDGSKILIVNLHGLGEGNADVIGAFVVWEILAAAYARGEMEREQRRPFHLILDEFQKFSSTAVPMLIEECRKYGVDTIIAHQHRRQLEGQTLGTTLTTPNRIVLQVTGEDAAVLAREFRLTVPSSEPVPQILTEPVMQDYIDTSATSPEIEQVQEELARVNDTLAQLRPVLDRLSFEATVLQTCFVQTLNGTDQLPGLEVLEDDHKAYSIEALTAGIRAGQLPNFKHQKPDTVPDKYWQYDRRYKHANILRSLNPDHSTEQVREYAKGSIESARRGTLTTQRFRFFFPPELPTFAETQLAEQEARSSYHRMCSDEQCRAFIRQLRAEFLAVFLPMKKHAAYWWDAAHAPAITQWDEQYSRDRSRRGQHWIGGPKYGGCWELTDFPEVLAWLKQRWEPVAKQRRETDWTIQRLEREQQTLTQRLQKLQTRQRYLGYDRVVKDTVGTGEEQARYTRREGSPRTIDDVANELANQLANFPPFFARCKFGTSEHTILTRKPVKVTEAQRAMAEQLKASSATTYGRERAAVEAEISRRRQTSAITATDATMGVHADNPPTERPDPSLSNVFDSDDI